MATKTKRGKRGAGRKAERTESRNPGRALAVVVEKPKALAPARPARQMQTLAEYERNHQALAKFVKRYLKPGDNSEGDYGYIVRKDGSKVSEKLVLFKSGAEKLADLYRLGSKMTCVREEEDYGKEKATALFLNYTYRCDLFWVDRPDVILAQCEGAANSKERACQDEGRPQPANSIRKRAQKRAYVGAVIMATRSSQWFTQDMEDKAADGGPNVQEAAKPEGRKKLEARLHILAGEVGESKPDVDAYLKEIYGNKSATKLKEEELKAEVVKLSLARDIVGLAKASGLKVEEVRQIMTEKYEFRGWMRWSAETLRKMLTAARAKTGVGQ